MLTHHDIYEAATDDSLYDLLPGRLAQEIDAPSALFFWLHPGSVQEITAGTQPETNGSYEEVMSQDPWMAQVSDDKAGRGAFRLTETVPAAEFERSVMYNEFIVKNRLDRFWCLGMVQNTRDGQVVTAFHKGKRGGDFSDREIGLINRHTRDLERLHMIRRELLRHSIGDLAAGDRSLPDEAPMFELNHESRLLRMNAKGETLLRRHPLFVLRRDHRLALGDGTTGPLRDAVGQATGPAADQDRARATALELAQTRGQDGRIFPRLRLNFLPRTAGGRRVLVIITAEDPVALRLAFEAPQENAALTSRERDVLRGLVQGRRRDQLAHELAISVATVDLHCANLRRKLDCRTMTEAIALAVMHGLL